MKIVKVNLEYASYPIFIGENIFPKLEELIASSKLYKNLFFVVDKNVYKQFSKYIKKIFYKHDEKKYFYKFCAIEKNKSYDELKKIHSKLLEKRFGRDTLLISVGGGITCDLSGFAASTYMRGVQLIHIPTTLIAMVDSSIGGKTGINFELYKNMVGTFYQPKLVLCDIDFISTLSNREMISGCGELIKYAFITSKHFYEKINDKLPAIISKNKIALSDIIYNSVQFKASIVNMDENEKGLRKVLNFGHTFAHAFEKESKNKISHGEAVTVGIVCALFLSNRKKLISNDALKKYLELTGKLKINKSIFKVDPEQIYKIMFTDKKNLDEKISLVLLKDIGELVLDVHASKAEIIWAINSAIENLNLHHKYS
jgi:3-dehydroquinate synthase